MRLRFSLKLHQLDLDTHNYNIHSSQESRIGALECHSARTWRYDEHD